MTELLQTESEQYKKELDSLRETNEMRQQKMLQRARELKAAREQERQNLVEQQLQKKWRNEAEELREHASKEITKKIHIEQLEQLRQKEEKRQKELEGE